MDSFLPDTPDDVISYYQPDSTLRIVINRQMPIKQQRHLKRRFEAMRGVQSCRPDQLRASIAFTVAFHKNAAAHTETIRQDIRIFAVEYLRITGIQLPLF